MILLCFKILSVVSSFLSVFISYILLTAVHFLTAMLCGGKSHCICGRGKGLVVIQEGVGGMMSQRNEGALKCMGRIH